MINAAASQLDVGICFVVPGEMPAPQAIEPIRVDSRIGWRVGANCVEVDPTTWHAKRHHDQQESTSSTQPLGNVHGQFAVGQLLDAVAQDFLVRIRSDQLPGITGAND